MLFHGLFLQLNPVLISCITIAQCLNQGTDIDTNHVICYTCTPVIPAQICTYNFPHSLKCLQLYGTISQLRFHVMEASPPKSNYSLYLDLKTLSSLPWQSHILPFTIINLNDYQSLFHIYNVFIYIHKYYVSAVMQYVFFQILFFIQHDLKFTQICVSTFCYIRLLISILWYGCTTDCLTIHH